MTKTKSLVIIVGAGASNEAGLPIGDKLKDQIASVLKFRFRVKERTSGDEDILRAINLVARQQGQSNISPYLHACLMISDAMPLAPSIDNFINAHRDDEKIALCGKLAIARCMLEAEAKSADFSHSKNKMDFNALESTWYTLFFRLLVENEKCQSQDIPGYLSNIAIIDFNYDRCLEYYLHAALMNYYTIKIDEAKTLISSLRVFRPYGSLGSLSWNDHGWAVNFGATPTSDKLIKIANELKTFTEGTDETHSEIAELRATLQSAKRVVFLGFAFNPQNLDLLYGPPRETADNESSSVFATAFNISESNIETISSELRTRAGYKKRSVQIRNLKCAQFLQEYSRSLAIR